ncbi:MAG: DNA repair protein RadC [Pedobacter sp.]|nr:DNA repair protein RadC [Pedobacter sp.]
MENSENIKTSIKNWAEDDRPREKMARHGAEILSNAELIAIIINNGNKEKSAVELAKDILKLGSDNLDELGKLSIKDFQKIKGIGVAKAISITAALELGRRRSGGEVLQRTKVSSSKEIAQYLRSILKDNSNEVFAVLFLNQANKIKNFKIMSKGGITGTVADPRVILKQALDEGATSLVLSHNHPSGNLKPSRADQDLTNKIKQAASYFDIKILDHIIVSDEGHFSFADEGLL